MNKEKKKGENGSFSILLTDKRTGIKKVINSTEFVHILPKLDSKWDTYTIMTEQDLRMAEYELLNARHR